MAELTTATEIALVDIGGAEILPIREVATPGLLKVSLNRLKAWLLGSSAIFINTTGAVDGDVLVFDTIDDTFKPAAPSGGISGVNLEEAGTPVSGGPFSTLNFQSGATVSDAGGGTADIVGSGGGGGGGGWTLIDIATPSGTGTVSFTGIVDDYEELVISGFGRTTNSTTTELRLTFNNDTGANYSWQRLFSNTSTIASQQQLNQNSMLAGELAGTGAFANVAGAFELTISNYKDPVFHKTMLMKWLNAANASNQNTMYLIDSAGVWADDAPITEIDLTLVAGNFVAGSEIRLYGRGASVGGGGGGGSGYGYEASPTIPDASDYTAVNHVGTTALIDGANCVILSETLSGFNQLVRCALKAQSAVPFDWYVRFDMGPNPQTGGAGGIVFRNSANGRLEIFGPGGGADLISRTTWNSVTSYNGVPWSGIAALHGPPKWWKVSCDGTNISISGSRNGVDYDPPWGTFAIATWLGGLTDIGFCIMAGTSALKLYIYSDSFTVPTL